MSVVSKVKRKLYFVGARYFRYFANISLKRWKPRIFAITGSAGKTTMLHLLEFELGKKAHYSHDANSAFGVAFDILGMKGIKGSRWKWVYLFFATPIRAIFFTHKEKYYVVEIDGERPHETEFLAKWLRPEVTFWISMGLSHAAKFEATVDSGEFNSLSEAITHEFAELPKYTSKRVYIDADSKEMETGVQGAEAKIFRVKKEDLIAYRVTAKSSDFLIDGVKMHFAAPEPPDMALQLIMLKDFCEYLKRDFKADFSEIELPPGRSGSFEGKNGLTLIDSTYNAHIISVESIFEMVKRMRLENLWLVMGDIIDQGSIEHHEHEKLAEMIRELQPKQVILIGPRTKKYTAPKLAEYGIPTVVTTEPEKALEYIEENAKNEETILFKGSQYLEWIVEKLLKNPEDEKKLCRRDKAAKKRREKRGLK